MALTAMLYIGNSVERRESPRRRIGAETTLRRSGSATDAVLHDLSCSGALIEAAVPLVPGSTVTIGLAGVGRFPATVVTATGRQAGCRFVEPLSPEALARAFAGETVVAGAFHESQTASHFPDPDVGKYPGYMRVALPVAGAIGGWLAIVQAFRAAFS